MDSGTTRIVSHDATDMELQRFPIPSREQGLNASYASILVEDGRHEYRKKYATFYDSSTPLLTQASLLILLQIPLSSQSIST